MKTIAKSWALLSLAGCFAGCVSSNKVVVFDQDVRPIIESRCLECHNHRYDFAGLNMESRDRAMKGGRSGPVIVAGSPDQSLFYKVLLLGHESPVAMPPSPDKLNREQQKIVHDWIAQGANWPEGQRLKAPQDWAEADR